MCHSNFRGVLNMYNAGMGNPRGRRARENDPLYPGKDPLLRALNLNQQDLTDLKAFLEWLTERRRRVRVAASSPN